MKFRLEWCQILDLIVPESESVKNISGSEVVLRNLDDLACREEFIELLDWIDKIINTESQIIVNAKYLCRWMLKSNPEKFRRFMYLFSEIYTSDYIVFSQIYGSHDPLSRQRIVLLETDWPSLTDPVRQNVRCKRELNG